MNRTIRLLNKKECPGKVSIGGCEGGRGKEGERRKLFGVGCGWGVIVLGELLGSGKGRGRN